MDDFREEMKQTLEAIMKKHAGEIPDGADLVLNVMNFGGRFMLRSQMRTVENIFFMDVKHAHCEDFEDETQRYQIALDTVRESEVC